MRRLSLGFLVATAMLIAAPSGASAVTIGETFTPTVGCGADQTWLQSGSPGDGYAASSDGVITSWSFQAGSSPPQLKFKVARPAGGDNFTIVGESALRTPVADELNTYAVQIPVQVGDVIGFYTATAGGCERVATGYTYSNTSGDPPPGTTASFGSFSGEQFDISANLETKKCKGKAPTMAGTTGNDTLRGTPGKDVIVGLEGKDTLKGFGGKDRLCGLKGKDTLKGGGADDFLKGAKGPDRLKGGSGEDTCIGGKSEDTAAKCEIEKSI